MENEPLLRAECPSPGFVGVGGSRAPESGEQNASGRSASDDANVQQRYGDLCASLEGKQFPNSGQTVKPGDFKVYKSRWYVLVVYSCVAFMQGGLGNVWIVIAQSAEAAFGWTDATVSLMQNWLYLTYLVGFFPFAWLIDKHGLRVAFVLSSLLLALGTMFRCLTSSPPLVTWFAHLGHVLVGLAGPVAFGAATVVSADWFPAHQRNTATAVATLSGFSGCAFTFVFGPNIVHQPQGGFQPTTNCSEFLPDPGFSKSNVTDIEPIREEIMLCRYIEFSICGALFLIALIHFPSKPPTPPTISAGTDKTDLVEGLKQLFRRENSHFWLLAIPYALSLGVYGAWSGLVDVNLKALGVTESEAGWLGFYSVLAGCGAGIVLGRINDLLSGHMKTFLLIIMGAELLFTFWFLLIAAAYIPFSTVGVYVSFIAQGVLMNASVPLFYELSIEKVHPIAEVVTTGMLNMVYNIIPPFFLLIFLIPNIGTSWMNWCMYGCLLLSVPLIMFFKEDYKRLKLDTKINSDTEQNM